MHFASLLPRVEHVAGEAVVALEPADVVLLEVVGKRDGSVGIIGQKAGGVNVVGPRSPARGPVAGHRQPQLGVDARVEHLRRQKLRADRERVHEVDGEKLVDSLPLVPQVDAGD